MTTTKVVFRASATINICYDAWLAVGKRLVEDGFDGIWEHDSENRANHEISFIWTRNQDIKRINVLVSLQAVDQNETKIRIEAKIFGFGYDGIFHRAIQQLQHSFNTRLLTELDKVSNKQQNMQRMDRKKSNPRKEAKPGQIFISYRRSDSADIVGRIYDRLVGKFGKDPIFKDVDSIPLGLDFKEYLDQKVGECVVLLAIIGDHWVDASDSTGKSRLHDPSDFVRIEIQSALERGIPVIPLLVRNAQMPLEQMLPTDLRKLVFRNGIPIRSDPDFHRDMDRLIKTLEKLVHKEE